MNYEYLYKSLIKDIKLSISTLKDLIVDPSIKDESKARYALCNIIMQDILDKAVKTEQEQPHK